MHTKHRILTYVIYGVGAVIVLGLIGLGIGWALDSAAGKSGAAEQTSPEIEVVLPTATVTVTMATSTPVVVATATPEPTPTHTPTPTPTPPPLPFEEAFIYGTSVEDRPLQGYRLGTGVSARFIIGAIHGGYEWNTVEVVSKTLEYYREHREELPSNVALYLIPLANPDGYAAGRDAIVGRTNAHSVDLNRNWDYAWQPTATHGTRPVSAGTAPFSEPETAALRDLLLEKRPDAVIFYHSAMGVVFSGADRENSFTYELAEVIAAATGYRHQTEGIPGQITTGDAIDWLSSMGIAGTEVELTTHASIDEAEWQRNLKGIKAFLDWQAPQAGVADEGATVETPSSGVPINGQPTPEPLAGYKWYTIPEKITLSHIVYEICQNSNITLDELVELNQIADPNLVGAGDTILIPEDCQ
ncbi:MAG TPA: M14 family zinc carboxypeptidase [Anaerolineae bacterium]|nr:M14 family zinc carboxypeptidase [Anaerolineae bacterium]